MAMPDMPIRQLMALPTSTELHDKIRRLWIQHSIAEDSRDIPGLMATLAPDCVYHLLTTGERWEGHAGATAFYTSLLAAFPDIHFDLTDIVIGPQGVYECANANATHLGTWAGVPATGQHGTFQVQILFPWNDAAQLFSGEKMWSNFNPTK